jgi:hypothetical protein
MVGQAFTECSDKRDASPERHILCRITESFLSHCLKEKVTGRRLLPHLKCYR